MKRVIQLQAVLVLTLAMTAMGRPGPAPIIGNQYYSQADFYAAAGPDSLLLEDFEDEPTIGTGDDGAQALITLDDFIASSTPSALKILDEPFVGNHNTTPAGQKYLSADTDISYTSAEVTLTFDEPITAFGLYLVDVEEFVNVTIAGATYIVQDNGNGGESYFGIISPTPFTTVHLDMGTTDSHTSMDDVAYTPEPASLFLLGSGALLMLGKRRQQRR